MGQTIGPKEAAARAMNRCIEDWIRRMPGQYLWGYARYKQPRVEVASTAADAAAPGASS